MGELGRPEHAAGGFGRHSLMVMSSMEVHRSATHDPPVSQTVASLLDEAHDRIVAEIGESALTRHARHGSALSGDDIIATALHALDAVRTSLTTSPSR